MEIPQSLSNQLKFSASPLAESPCHGVRDPPFTFIFFVSEKVVFSEGTCSQNRGKKGKDMEETVETVQGLRDGIQVHSSFHTHVKELEYKDLLTRTQGSLSSFFLGID